jgi:hypothetical protein
MCESLIFLRSGSTTPPGTFVFQWIMPTLQAVYDGTGVMFIDASGTTSTEPGGLSCGGWTSASSDDVGLVVSQRGRYSTFSCDNEFAVACCRITSGQ